MNNNLIKNGFPYDEYKKTVAEINAPIVHINEAVEFLNKICKVTNGMLNVDVREGIQHDLFQLCRGTEYPYNMELSGERIVDGYRIGYCLHLLFLKLEKIIIDDIPFLVINAGGLSDEGKNDGVHTYIQCGDIVVINPTHRSVYNMLRKQLELQE